MDEDIIKFQIPVDDDGYLTLQCPFCGEFFKISGEVAESEDYYQLYCPYCGLQSEPNDFFTKDVLQHVEGILENYMAQMINTFADDFEKSFSSSSFLKFEDGEKITTNEPKVLFEENNMDLISFQCCDKNIKVFYKNQGKLYCPFCGVK